MFARRVVMQLKPNSVPEFTQKLDKEIIPLLKKQNGFKDEITFVSPDGKEVFGMSLWDQKENAENYNRTTYPEVAKILGKLVAGTPQVESYEVCNSTFHKITPRPIL
jgi:heme-degrading monooxygenase HmoA